MDAHLFQNINLVVQAFCPGLPLLFQYCQIRSDLPVMDSCEHSKVQHGTFFQPVAAFPSMTFIKMSGIAVNIKIRQRIMKQTPVGHINMRGIGIFRREVDKRTHKIAIGVSGLGDILIIRLVIVKGPAMHIIAVFIERIQKIRGAQFRIQPIGKLIAAGGDAFKRAEHRINLADYNQRPPEFHIF